MNKSLIRPPVKILMLVLIIGFSLPAIARATPDPVTCTGYPEPRVMLESQGWWATSGHYLLTGNDQGNNFGHIHMAMCFPLFQKVSGTVSFDLTLLMHDNPGTLVSVNPFTCSNDQGNDCHKYPPAKYNPPLVCTIASCTFTQHFDLDTNLYPYNGIATVRIRPQVHEPDGTELRTADNFLMDVENGGSKQHKDYVNGPTYIEGKAWYEGFYAKAQVFSGYTPNPSSPFTISFRCGSTSEPVDSCLAMVDPAFHALPPTEGTVLLRNSLSDKQTLTVDTSQFPAGVHYLVLRSCAHDTLAVPGKDAHRCGVLKLPFTGTG